MRSIVSFHPGRDRLVVFVKMNTDENAFFRPISERGAIRQGYIAVADASHQRRDTFGIEEPIDAARNVQRQILFHDSATHRAGIFPPMARIKNHYRKWFGRLWRS